MASPGNTVDLVLTNNEFFVKQVSLHLYAFDSDHHPVTFGFNIETKRPNYIYRGESIVIKKADFKGLRDTANFYLGFDIIWHLLLLLLYQHVFG